MATITRVHLIFLLVPWLCLMVQPAWATRAYVTDFFEITLRTRPSIENKVIAMIPTGQPAEILSSSEGWSHVRLLGSKEGNKEGWVLSRFLVDRPPWKTRARSIKDENARLREELSSSERKLSESLHREEASRSTLKVTKKTVQTLADENRKLRTSQRHRWFIIGALVLLCGVIIGLVMGRRQRSKSYY
jgi:SH3 domain protein